MEKSEKSKSRRASICKYFVQVKKLPAELQPGIEEISQEYPLGLKKTKGAKEIYFSKDRNLAEKGGVKVQGVEVQSKIGISVYYGRKIDAFRGLGRIFGKSGEFSFEDSFAQYPHFDMLGIQLESSRNGVMTVDNVKAFIRRLSLMGINVLMLYTEDTYEVAGQPFFGYLRGRYTQKELRQLDDYAFNLGIEMFLSMQTLAHLRQALQWGNAFADVTDTEDILLVGEEKTYKLLEEMLKSASAPFRSKRIHLGMDEAHALGTGKYRQLHGERSTFAIMNEHLARVCQICNRLGLKPMIWSDMFFRIGSKTHAYYDLNAQIPQQVIKHIPREVDLVYWDYYHQDSDFYAKFIQMHRDLGKEPIVAPGAQNWTRFWSALDLAYATIGPCMLACKEKKVRQAFLTTWGDDGMENDIYSALPALQFFAEHGYAERIDQQLLKANFRAICKADMDAYNLASHIDAPACLKGVTRPNISKWLLWDDPLLGLCQPLQEGQSFRKHYTNLANKLKKTISKDASKRLFFPLQIARVLAIKCDCRKGLVAAYRKKDKKGISRLLKEEVIPLLKEVRKLWRIHRHMWLATYKPFGLEVIDRRYGGLIARLENLRERLEGYLKGRLARIPEFETTLLKFEPGSKATLHGVHGYQRIATPSAIK